MEALLVRYMNGPWAGTELIKEVASEIKLTVGTCHYWHYKPLRQCGNVVDMWGDEVRYYAHEVRKATRVPVGKQAEGGGEVREAHPEERKVA